MKRPVAGLNFENEDRGLKAGRWMLDAWPLRRWVADHWSLARHVTLGPK